MSDLNLTVLTGRLTKNAEMSYTQNGNCICKFTLANNESRKDNNGEWYDVASFLIVRSLVSMEKQCLAILQKAAF